MIICDINNITIFIFNGIFSNLVQPCVDIVFTVTIFGLFCTVFAVQIFWCPLFIANPLDYGNSPQLKNEPSHKSKFMRQSLRDRFWILVKVKIKSYKHTINHILRSWCFSSPFSLSVWPWDLTFVQWLLHEYHLSNLQTCIQQSLQQ